MVRSEKPGLSGGHKISYGRPSFQNRSKKISINRTGAEIKLARERQKEHIAGAYPLSKYILLLMFVFSTQFHATGRTSGPWRAQHRNAGRPRLLLGRLARL
jgi:hypothetical protein